MTDSVDDLLAYIDHSPTPYHAVATSVARLEAAGFRSLEEHDVWALSPGDRRFVVRNGSSLLAFEVGARPPAEAGFRVVGAHTDSPNLRVKPAPGLKKHGYGQLAVEPYGGLLLHTWLDRDLSLAGRVSLRTSEGVETSLVDFERPLLRIPNLAIHLYRELNEEGLKLNAQQHMAPLLGLGEDLNLVELLCEELGKSRERISPTDMLAWDLMLYDIQPGTRSGARDEFIHVARLDNLASSHAGLEALARAGEGGASEVTRVVVLYDHEEVGSRSREGAGGPFLAETLERIGRATSNGTDSTDAFARAIARSWLISADMAHAVHPNYADRHEPNHRPVIGGGPVIKKNSNQAYATNAETAALFADLCRRVDVPHQDFVTRSDLGCGSTIGPISASRVGIRTVDVGNPMLSMHSCREMAGSGDVESMIAVLTEFFRGD